MSSLNLPVADFNHWTVLMMTYDLYDVTKSIAIEPRFKGQDEFVFLSLFNLVYEQSLGLLLTAEK